MKKQMTFSVWFNIGQQSIDNVAMLIIIDIKHRSTGLYNMQPVER